MVQMCSKWEQLLLLPVLPYKLTLLLCPVSLQAFPTQPRASTLILVLTPWLLISLPKSCPGIPLLEKQWYPICKHPNSSLWIQTLLPYPPNLNIYSPKPFKHTWMPSGASTMKVSKMLLFSGNTVRRSKGVASQLVNHAPRTRLLNLG